MRVVFMGTPEFAVDSLEQLYRDGADVAAVFTQPDRPAGRKFRLTPPPVKVCAQAHGTPVCQPKTLKDPEVQKMLKTLAPDCIVVAAYGRILPDAVLNIPPLGCVNVHGSLLPRYRGAAPIQWAVVNGEAVTGVTTMYMAKGIDTGDIIIKEQTAVGEDETAGALYARLGKLGARVLSETLALLAEGKAPRTPQDDALSTYAPMIAREDARVNFAKSARAVHNLARGMNPEPGAFTLFAGAPLKLLDTRVAQEAGGFGSHGEPGLVLESGDCGVLVQCGEGTLLLTQVQGQGGRQMPAADFARGHRLGVGTVLGK